MTERTIGIRADQPKWIAARDRAQDLVLLAGLLEADGVTGLGRIWCEDRAGFQNLPDYATAPEASGVLGHLG